MQNPDMETTVPVTSPVIPAAGSRSLFVPLLMCKILAQSNQLEDCLLLC